MGNNEPDDEERDLFLSLLSYEGDMLDIPGHMGIGHDAPWVSHGIGKAEWLLYFTASSESILTKTVKKTPAYWKLLDSRSEKLLRQVRHVFQSLGQVDPISTALDHILKLQFSPVKTPQTYYHSYTNQNGF